MINLLPHHRFHIPNSLAILAALLLVISSIVGFEANQEANSTSQENGISVKAGSTGTDSISDPVENKSRGINVRSLLFRRG